MGGYGVLDKKGQKKVYLIGSLRNPKIVELEMKIRALGFNVFASWFAAGPEADDCWKKYERARGLTFKQALQDYAANNVFAFDFGHLESSDIVVLALPAGKSGHMEFMDAVEKGKKGFILIDDPERWDVMYLLAVKKMGIDVICENFDELAKNLTKIKEESR